MKKNNNGMFALSLSLVVVMIGFGVVIPVFPLFIDKLGASGIQLGFLTATYAVTQFIFAPIWGTVSDRTGRKPIMVIGMAGNAVTMLLMGLSHELWQVYIIRALSGILSSATMPSVMAYASDNTSEDERNLKIGRLMGAMGIGVIIGPGIGGWLSELFFSLPFYISAVLSLVSVILIIITVSESEKPVMPEKNRINEQKSGKFPDIKSLSGSVNGIIGILLFLIFLMSFALTSFQGIFGLYTLKKFGYGPREMGTILVIMGVISTSAQYILTGPVTKKIGERRIIIYSLLLASIMYPVFTIVSGMTGILVVIALFIFALALLRPSITTMISKYSAGTSGRAMGLSNSAMSLGRIAGPILAGALFDYNINLPFYSGAVIMLGGFIFSFFFLKDRAYKGIP